MNKLNKKGFTLIEMLVVIAIIAVLVSIIIPVVGNSTDKAACAANAANLRSVKAEMVTKLLTDGNTASVRGITLTATDAGSATPTGVTFKALNAAPAGVGNSNNFTKGGGFTYKITSTNEVTVYYDGLTIDDWAKGAAGSAASGS